jgi:hypothetical protein
LLFVNPDDCREGSAGALFLASDMPLENLQLEVQRDEIIVTLPHSRYGITYYKSASSPQLLARRIPLKDDPVASTTLSEFLVRAWKAANEKARSLGWIA